MRARVSALAMGLAFGVVSGACSSGEDSLSGAAESSASAGAGGPVGTTGAEGACAGVTGYPTVATENAVQANIAAAGYGT